MRRLAVGFLAAIAALIGTALPALACGGLVAPDGDVRLDKATTFVAWHGGVEHYVTSFAYSGSAPDIGWIVPLPAVPTAITAAGRWTLQRLEREFAPPLAFAEDGAAAAPEKAVVVEQVQVEALDITVLRGSGAEVIDWCVHNGFRIPADTHSHLLTYARGTQVFMAAKYNASTAQSRGLLSGDGVPLLITMRTPQLWVPLEVLADDGNFVNADLFLLTDSALHSQSQTAFWDALFAGNGVDGAEGFNIAGQEPMNQSLHHDLASDRNMSWVPANGWITYLHLGAPSESVMYDLGVGSDSVIRLAAFGTPPDRVVTTSAAAIAWPLWPLAAVAAVALLATVLYVAARSRLTMSTGSTLSAGSKPSTRPRK